MSPSRWVDLLASGRLAVVLLALLVLLLGVYLLVPQRGQIDEPLLRQWVERGGLPGRAADGLGLTDIQRSWVLWQTYALLFVNLLLCMIRRARAALSLWRMPAEPPAVPTQWRRRQVEAPWPGAETVARVLARRGYRTLVASTRVYGLRGRFAVAGHWLFHVGMLLLLVAGVAVAVGPARFRGLAGVGEGETFDFHRSRFINTNTGGSARAALPALGFRVERVTAVPADEGVQELAASLRTSGGEATTVAVNRPYREAPYQVLIQGFGYMPGWVVVDARGRQLEGAWLKLAPVPIETVPDAFSFGEGGFTVELRFFPNHARRDGEDESPSHELRNPKFRVRIQRGDALVQEGLLAPGQRVALGDGRAFFFLPQIRRYALLDVIEEEGHAFVFAAFGVVILGLLIRYARIRKEVVVEASGASILVSGRGELFEHLFGEELDRLVAELERAQPAPDDTMKRA